MYTPRYGMLSAPNGAAAPSLCGKLTLDMTLRASTGDMKAQARLAHSGRTCALILCGVGLLRLPQAVQCIVV